MKVLFSNFHFCFVAVGGAHKLLALPALPSSGKKMPRAIGTRGPTIRRFTRTVALGNRRAIGYSTQVFSCTSELAQQVGRMELAYFMRVINPDHNFIKQCSEVVGDFIGKYFFETPQSLPPLKTRAQNDFGLLNQLRRGGYWFGGDRLKWHQRVPCLELESDIVLYVWQD
ncbi:MAG: hypothetical protein JNM09_00860 [Blastocatellia bacterium]|nr:hypothetical protein [Blastocatellia bacterium]